MPVGRDLPTGTVTFLFSDVEGSTQLLQRLGAEEYARALGEHRRVVRDAIVAEGGVEIGTEGDSFMVAYPTAVGALATARAVTEAFGDGRLRLRIGLHTGTPLVVDGDYVGIDVHRAARIAACGHGGQVLLSASTAALVGGDGLRDLGEHRLKDLSAPERIYQLGDGDFPPLKSLHQANLPVPQTPFLGRRRELAEVDGMLSRPDVRLLTLVGPGGTGKTRLALQAAADAADRYPAGVHWVSLAPLADAALVPDVVAAALGAKGSLAEFIGDRAMLVVVDNMEHVIAAAPELPQLLAACPNLNLFVTSRELLRVPGEHAYPVPPLAPPEGLELFVAQARAADPGFTPGPAVAELCARLEQLPLALELAAARVRVLSAEQLLDRLGQRLDVLKGGRGVDERQQTLRATIQWSHDLLDPEERRLFAALAVFAGGCTLEAAEQVCGADIDVLQSLVDKSLVRARESGRFWMLETIRQFAAEGLARSNDQKPLRRRHAEYFIALAESANLSQYAEGGEARQGLLAGEQPNVRAVLEWALERREADLGARMALAVQQLWAAGQPAEGIRWFDTFLAFDDLSDKLRARALCSAGGMADHDSQRELAHRRYLESLAVYRQLEDEDGLAFVLMHLGHSYWYQGDPGAAREAARESLEICRRRGLRRQESQVLGLLGDLEFEGGDPAAGFELLEQATDMAASAGYPWWQARMLLRRCRRMRERGTTEQAEALAEQSLRLALEIEDHRRIVQTVDLLAVFAAERGDTERAGLLRGAVAAELERDSVPGYALLALPPGCSANAQFEDAVQRGGKLELAGVLQQI